MSLCKVLIVGSVAYDGLRTPHGVAPRVLGGSATYSSLAAALFAPVSLVAVVGEDFLESDIRLFKQHDIDLRGLQRVKGKTFFWKGVYEKDMNIRRTLKTELNVFADFRPVLHKDARKSPYVFLANIHPALQGLVLDQMQKPRFAALDTMNLWIKTQRAALKRVLGRVDLAVLNDQEARQLTGESLLPCAAARVRRMGPRLVIIKKGEHGAYVQGPGWSFLSHAVPLERVVDPTGAGDSFAGGVIGYLARKDRIDAGTLKEAVHAGTLVASFTVQDFSVKALAALTPAKLRSRAKTFYRLTEPPRIRV